MSVEIFKNDVLGTHKDMQMKFIDQIILAHKKFQKHLNKKDNKIKNLKLKNKKLMEKLGSIRKTFEDDPQDQPREKILTPNSKHQFHPNYYQPQVQKTSKIETIGPSGLIRTIPPEIMDTHNSHISQNKQVNKPGS